LSEEKEKEAIKRNNKRFYILASKETGAETGK